jgi:hypothetical protein
MQDSKNLDADISSLIEHDVRLDGALLHNDSAFRLKALLYNV